MRAAADALAARWAAAPPAQPVIVAGSTGSRAPTRAFMAAVARLPQGALVLPGLDPGLPPAVWDRLAERRAGGRRPSAARLPPARRGARLRPRRGAGLARRPRRRTRRATRWSRWRCGRRRSPTSGAPRAARCAPSLAAAAEGLTWIEAPDQKREALAIALLLREAAETGTRAALVTPDRTLARRVAAELDRWGLIPDDSAGRPLALTPPGCCCGWSRRCPARR